MEEERLQSPEQEVVSEVVPEGVPEGVPEEVVSEGVREQVFSGEVISGEAVSGGFAESRRLLRSRRERMIGGVCGGLAGYLGFDPLLVRGIYVVLTLVTGIFPGVLLYILAMVLVPEDTSEGPAAAAGPRPDSRVLWGGLLILAGLYFLARIMWGQFLPAEWAAQWSHFWGTLRGLAFPALLIGAGLLLVLGLSRRNGGAPAGRMTRPRHGRIVAGVCSGLARYFRLDPVWVRLFWVLLLLASFWTALVLYFVAMLLMPEGES